MPRIPDDEIDRLKASLDLPALIRARGIELKPHGNGHLIGLCPFHDDKGNPNMVVTPGKGLFHCLACGAAGNGIQFVQKFDGISFRHAFELLDEGGKAAFSPPPTGGRVRQGTTPKLENPLNPEATDVELMAQVIDYYAERLKKNSAALDYLESRGLNHPEALTRFRIGFADRSLGLRLPEKNRHEGKVIRERLQALGIYRKSGHEHFNGSIVVPVLDSGGHISEIYGRKINDNLRKGTPKHLYLPGPHTGIWNAEDAFASGDLILCEAPLDALTLWIHGLKNTTFIYGTQGFTEELFEGIKTANLDAVRLAYDADESGERAAKRDAERLQGIGVVVYRVRLPMGEDINSFARNHGTKALKKAIRSAEWLGSRPVPSHVSSLAADLAAKEITSTTNPVPETSEIGVNRCPSVVETPTLERFGEQHELALGDRQYRLGGLEKNGGLDSLKLTLRLRYGDHFHVDQLDLCKDQDRRRYCERAAHECRLEPELIKRDLGKLLLACERAQDARLRADLEPGSPAAVVLAPEERSAAEALLRAPDLIDRLDAAFDAAGIVGENTNRLAAYLTATSRLLDKPLAVIIQSTSAAGKSTLMEAVLAFFPPEEQVKYSAMTGQSLYYLGEKNLKHKILAIVEEEGAEKASYALKLLQSEGELTIASTGKDATTGRMETQEYHVEGPVSIVLTTTAIDIDEELMNRCLILSVDESRAQTERIHERQRQARTLEGLRRKKNKTKTLTLLQNAQRLLKPVDVVNPYADALTFTAERTRTRRDHEKYLTLIDAVTLLHQYQRERLKDEEGGEYLEVSLGDIELANRIAPEVLGRSLDELPPQTRGLLEQIKAMVAEVSTTRKIDPDQVWFTRREVRERSRQSETQVRLHLQRLEDLEYLQRRHGRNGIRCVYELMVDCHKAEGIAQVGLLDPGDLRKQA